MHVEDAAVFDTQFIPTSLRDMLVTSTLQKRESLVQLPAVSAICNAATMTNVGDASEMMGRKIMGRLVLKELVPLSKPSRTETSGGRRGCLSSTRVQSSTKSTREAGQNPPLLGSHACGC